MATSSAIPPSLRSVIKDNTGKLDQLTAKGANAVVRLALTRAANRVHSLIVKHRFSKTIRRSPWNYKLGGLDPLEDSGVLKRTTEKATVISRATKRGAGTARATIRSRSLGGNLRPPTNRHGERRTYRKIMEKVSADEQDAGLRSFRKEMKKILARTTVRKTRKGTIKRSLNASDAKAAGV